MIAAVLGEQRLDRRAPPRHFGGGKARVWRLDDRTQTGG